MSDTTGSGTPAPDSSPDRVPGQFPGWWKNPELIPTPSLSPAQFEGFTERLLSAHRFCEDTVRHVVRVERWGRPGDKQHGIDFEGTFSDGRSAAWQCKRYDTLTPSDVREAVEAVTFTADEYYLVYSGEASSLARAEIRNHDGWQLLDRRALGRLLDDLPLSRRRAVLDATWSPQVRRQFLEIPGEDAFLSIDTVATLRRDPNSILNDLGAGVGRTRERAALHAAFDRGADYPRVVLVTGPGGRGKTRLLVETLLDLQQRQSSVPVLALSPGHHLDAAALAELPYAPAVIFVDDAHTDPSAIARLLTYCRTVAGTQLVLSSRPSAVPAIRAEVAAVYSPGQIGPVAVEELTPAEARRLVSNLTEGLGLGVALCDYLAAQATHSPHVAVIAANLIHRGELTAALGVDENLREQVMGRYQELMAPHVDGLDGDTTRRFLATYAALGPVDEDDEALRAQIAGFCALSPTQLLRLSQRLRDRGVLVTQGSGTRMVPDVLADHILEGEAAVGGHDTGFADELWETFHSAVGNRLYVSLAELDWRLHGWRRPDRLR